MVPRFRAWDRKNKVMRDVKGLIWEETDLIGHCNLIAHCPPRGHEFNEWFTVVLDGSEYQLMQSTGLKDKNGVEVFQGDIVKCTSGCPHEVVWLKEYAGMYIGGMPAWYLSGLSEGYAWTGDEEVIGNIHENPELLEQDNA